MYTIQYRHPSGGSAMKEIDTRSRTYLVKQLATFEHPILEVYEQATPITKSVRNDLRTYSGTLSTHARDFLSFLR